MPSGFSKLGAFAEIRIDEVMPDRFDHLDRDGLVELPGQVAVILEQHRDALRQALGGDALDGVVVLRARNGGGRDAASVVFGRVNRKPAPSRSNLDQVIGRAQLELAADAIDLRQRRLLERRVGALEDRARVHQGAIENQLEEIVAEVVMRRDVALAAGFGVAIQVVEEAADGTGQAREAAVHALHHVAVANHDLHERGQIVRRPRAGHVRFAGADTAGEREVGIEAAVPDTDGGAQIGLVRILSEREALAAIFDHEAAAFDSRQTAKNRAARETIDDGRATCPRRIDARRDNRIRLGHRSDYTAVAHRGASAGTEGTRGMSGGSVHG